MIIYGRNPVREAIRGPRAVSHLWATRNSAREPWLQSAGVRVTVSPPDEIERRCGSAAHQGICADVSAFRYADPDALLARSDAVIVALDQVQDPQNLGAICRTAECAGVVGVVLPERRSAEVTAAVCKASAGAVEHLPICRTRNLADFLHAAREAGFWSYGADAAGALGYDAVDYSGSVVIVLGAEGKGLRPRVAAACDGLVSIPLHGRIESLSASAAAAVLLYAVERRRGPAPR